MSEHPLVAIIRLERQKKMVRSFYECVQMVSLFIGLERESKVVQPILRAHHLITSKNLQLPRTRLSTRSCRRCVISLCTLYCCHDEDSMIFITESCIRPTVGSKHFRWCNRLHALPRRAHWSIGAFIVHRAFPCDESWLCVGKIHYKRLSEANKFFLDVGIDIQLGVIC